MLKCGMCELDITPSLGSSIPGYFEDRRSNGILDLLYAKALVVETEATTIAIVSLDTIMVSRPVVLAIRERVAAHTGIAASAVMVSATHTHTGPAVFNNAFMTADEVYLDWMAEKAADAVILAYRGRKEARIGSGVGHESDIAFNRRFMMKDGAVRTNPGFSNPDIVHTVGPIDPEVLVVRIDDAAGNPIGVVTNYTCHTDVVGGTAYSADYPGELSRVLKHALGNDVVSMFLMGASGDINHLDFLNGAAEHYKASSMHYKKMGRILAGEVIKTREKILLTEHSEVAILDASFPVGYRKPNQEEITAAEQQIRTGSKGSIEYNFAIEMLKAAEHKAELVDIEVQTIRIGDLAIVGVPGELFVEFGLEIKVGSPFKFTAINELCNGSVTAYICTREAYKQGGYEPIITSNSNIAEEAGELLVEHSLELLQQLRASME